MNSEAKSSLKNSNNNPRAGTAKVSFGATTETQYDPNDEDPITTPLVTANVTYEYERLPAVRPPLSSNAKKHKNINEFLKKLTEEKVSAFKTDVENLTKEIPELFDDINNFLIKVKDLNPEDINKNELWQIQRKLYKLNNYTTHLDMSRRHYEGELKKLKRNVTQLAIDLSDEDVLKISNLEASLSKAITLCDELNVNDPVSSKVELLSQRVGRCAVPDKDEMSDSGEQDGTSNSIGPRSIHVSSNASNKDVLDEEANKDVLDEEVFELLTPAAEPAGLCRHPGRR